MALSGVARAEPGLVASVSAGLRASAEDDEGTESAEDRVVDEEGGEVPTIMGTAWV